MGWYSVNITISGDTRHFVLESYRRGSSEIDDVGDAVVDDMKLDLGRCVSEGWGRNDTEITGISPGTGGTVFVA